MKRRQTITTLLESAELVEAFKMMVDVAAVIVPEEEKDAKICFAGERIGGGGSVVLFELEIGAELQVFSEEEVSKKFVSDLCDFVIASITPPPAQDKQ